MSKYENGKIYKIVNDELNLTYYGSTISTLTKRLSQHKNNSKDINKQLSSKILFSTEINPKIYLVELFSCNFKIELERRERFYIENNDCINKSIPSRSKKEWQEDNKEKTALKGKKWYQDNKDKTILRSKIYAENNKEEIILYKKEYYQKNKEEISLKEKEKINCSCGSVVGIYKIRRHEKTKKHLNFII